MAGLMDDINAGLQQGMQSPLFNLGMGLISGAQPFANPGQQLMAAAGNTQAEQARQQQLYMQMLQMQMLRQQWPYMQQLFGQLGGLMGPPQGAQGGSQGSKGTKSKGQAQAAPAASAPAVGPFSASPAAPAPASASAATPAGVSAPSGLLDPMGLERFGLMASMFPMTQPLGKAAQAAASFEAQYNPALQTQLAAAKSAVAQDMALLQQAQASGAPPSILQGLQTKLQTDLGQLHIGSMSGILTRQMPNGSWTTTDPRTGLATNTLTGSTLMPGAAQAQQTMAAAHALGEAAGRTVDVGGIPIPEISVLSRGVSGNNSQSNSSGGNSLTDLLRRGTFQKQLGEEGGKQVLSYQQAADSARNANYALDQMLKDAEGVSQGPAAGVIEWGLKGIAGVGQLFGVAPPKSLSSYQELDKYANQVAFAATRQMGSREAAQIVHLQMQSNPNKELTASAFADLAGSMKAMNSYIMAKNLAIQEAAQQTGNPELASAQWTKDIDPRVWDLTLSPEMGEKWAPTIGKSKIEAAWPYLSPEEQQTIIANIPASVRKQWLASSMR